MKLRPLHDWAMIRRVASADKTSGGIIIPEAAKEKPAEGIIEAIGPGRYKKEPGRKGRYVPTVLKPGQRILFTDYMAKDVEIDGNEFTFIREEDVLGLVEETGAIAIKKEHPLAEKRAQPVMVQSTLKSASEPVASGIKKPAAKKSKPEPKKPAAGKKPSKAKKSAPAKKKPKAPLKKTAPKKPAAGKSAQAKKAPKKTAVKKTGAKKPVKKAAAKSAAKKRK